ncbi:XrtN system VIT domain-containing protein [Flavitalea flava]
MNRVSFFYVLTRDRVWCIGLALIVLSLFIFCYPFFMPNAPTDGTGLFLLNYVCAVSYFIFIWVKGCLKHGNKTLGPIFLFLILFLISAYALNREMTVFEISTTWFATLLVLCCLNYLWIPVFFRLPSFVKHLVCFGAGVSLIVFLYLTLYLCPMYGIAALGAIFLGISLHTFVPLLFVIYTILFICREGSKRKSLYSSFFTGAGLIVVIVFVFVTRWSLIIHDMNRSYDQASDAKATGLPAWVLTAQRIPHGMITEKILKTGLVYSQYIGDWDLFRMPTRNFGEEKKHDPLVMIASMVAGKPELTEEQRINVLESLYDSRHQAQERLWSGDDLRTEKVRTKVELWPSLHIAYTEKTITIQNLSDKRVWRNQQEAIYTFHLPEGSVVSSLSLLIDGKEQPGLLTSKGKADSAYKRIVGYERRDPSVVHWQEGNTVSVRVFPVIAGESRQFKIGVTTPLQKKNEELVYENIYFDGPPSASAREDVVIRCEKPLTHLSLPSFFSSGNDQMIYREGDYKPDWSLRFHDEGQEIRSFDFAGKTYTLQSYQKQWEPMSLNKVYLDLNNSWTRQEFESVLAAVKDKKVFVYRTETNSFPETISFPETRDTTSTSTAWTWDNEPHIVALTPTNQIQLFEELSHNQFSLFPLFAITDPATSLLISKSPASSPSVTDLKNSPFAVKLQHHFSRTEKIRLYCLGEDLSPYLKALKEYRAFAYEQGDTAHLKDLIAKGQFVRAIENDNQIVMDKAGLCISRNDTAQTNHSIRSLNSGQQGSLAPDHLMRLFAYNHILERMGPVLGGMSPVETTVVKNEDEMVNEAQQAYVVSPVSSLVVLEKKEDYDRFNIQDNKNSLHNASLHSNGSAPEPGQWMLILIVLAALWYIRWTPASAKHKMPN